MSRMPQPARGQLPRADTRAHRGIMNPMPRSLQAIGALPTERQRCGAVCPECEIWSPIRSSRKKLRKADVILGVDRRTGQECGLFYGVSELKRISEKDHDTALCVLRVPLDQDTDEPEPLGRGRRGPQGVMLLPCGCRRTNEQT